MNTTKNCYINKSNTVRHIHGQNEGFILFNFLLTSPKLTKRSISKCMKDKVIIFCDYRKQRTQPFFSSCFLVTKYLVEIYCLLFSTYFFPSVFLDNTLCMGLKTKPWARLLIICTFSALFCYVSMWLGLTGRELKTQILYAEKRQPRCYHNMSLNTIMKFLQKKVAIPLNLQTEIGLIPGEIETEA